MSFHLTLSQEQHNDLGRETWSVTWWGDWDRGSHTALTYLHVIGPLIVVPPRVIYISTHNLAHICYRYTALEYLSTQDSRCISGLSKPTPEWFLLIQLFINIQAKDTECHLMLMGVTELMAKITASISIFLRRREIFLTRWQEAESLSGWLWCWSCTQTLPWWGALRKQLHAMMITTLPQWNWTHFSSNYNTVCSSESHDPRLRCFLFLDPPTESWCPDR